MKDWDVRDWILSIIILVLGMTILSLFIWVIVDFNLAYRECPNVREEFKEELVSCYEADIVDCYSNTLARFNCKKKYDSDYVGRILWKNIVEKDTK